MTEPSSISAQEHLVRVINDAWLTLALSLGERLGLNTLLASLSPIEATALAERAGVPVRSAEDWLWTLTAARIVEQSAGVFTLKPDYIDALTPSGGALHWSRIAEQIVAMATLEDALVGALRNGGGMPASAYEGRIVDVLAVESGPIFATALLDEVVPLLGVAERLDAGARVLDLGCGSGALVTILAERFPASRFVGVDQSSDAVRASAHRATDLGLTNAVFTVADLEDEWGPELQGPFDLVVAANVVHDLAQPLALFLKVEQRLAPAGVLYLHELGFSSDMTRNLADPHAIGVLVFGLYHCLPLAMRRAGIAPGGMWGRESYVSALREAGFTDVTVANAPSGPNNDTIIARR